LDEETAKPMPEQQWRDNAARAVLRRFWPLPLLVLIAGLTAAPFLGPFSAKMDFLGQFLLQAAAGTTATLVLFVIVGRWFAAGAAVLALLVQLVVLQPSFFPARAGSEAPATIDILFANVYWKNQRNAAMAEAIIALDPDVVVLVELDKKNRALPAALAAAYPHRVDCLAHWTCDGALLSRLPILEDLSDWRADRRIAMSAARIETAFGPIAVAGVHLEQPLPPGRLRRQERQTEGLTEMLAAIEVPLLLVGDFNSSPWGRLLQGLAADTGLDIAWGLEGTWPAILPWPMRITIDHALTGRGLELVDRQVIRLPGTDHMALKLRVAPIETVRVRGS
jgi:endonuclease/exonuclease/phosphatase (EEP) superfamily protein YafD